MPMDQLYLTTIKPRELESPRLKETGIAYMQQENTPNMAQKPDILEAQRFLTLLDEENEQFTFEIIEEPNLISRENYT